ncbi:MAG: 6-bladed beta-propeller [Nitrososphaeraceae archaeon]|nr:6-bladed beta-propeller [Nitrososphaeraceae archaeon]MDW0308468.1 6-bladed beta-propeller [Nitrososphaeraceae archaeon]
MKICPIHVAIAFLFVFVIILQINIVTGAQEIPFSPTKKQENYAFINEWGSKGTGNGEFLRPHDLEFSNGYKYLYAVDRDGNRIQVFNKNGTFLFKFGEKGQGDGQFLIPYGLDVDARGHVWVADRGNHRIQQFDSRGNFISKFGNEDSHPSSKLGKFDNPRHVEVDRNLEFVYVADSKNNRIQQFDINGTFVRAIGELGNKPGEFDLPTTIEQDSKGDFFVTERGNERIQKFDSKWKPLLVWGTKGSENNQFCHLEHLALDKHGNVYVTDPQSDPGCSMQARVLKFDNDGNFLAKFGSDEVGVGQLEDPEHLAVDTYGDVYVSDRKNNKILVFSRTYTG